HDAAEPVHGVGARPVRTDVVEPLEPLLYEPELLGVRLALEVAGWHADAPGEAQRDQLEDDESGEGPAHQRVLEPECDEGADEEQQPTEHTYRELRQEVREAGDVPVYPFDPLARGTRVVEPYVEVKGVTRQVLSQVVRGTPADRRRDVRGDGVE